MLHHLLFKRAALPDDEPQPEQPDDNRRAALAWELSVLRERIAQHRIDSATLYGIYDGRQGEAERRRSSEPDDADSWQDTIDALRAERVGAANERSNALREMRRRERELEELLGEGW